MIEIELSLMSHQAQPYPYMETVLQQFEAEHQIRVHLHMLSWDTGRTELVNYALFKNGPDVSEIGTTWLSSMVAMNVLRPFSPHEIAVVGGAEAFLPSIWKSCVEADGQILSIPWITYARNIYYRRDILQQCGIEEASAFQTAQNFSQTLQQIQTSGSLPPWATPSLRSPEILHDVAPWVWAAGGHFMSADGRSPRFHEPEAKQGFYNYFHHQFPYLTPATHNLSDSDSLDMFTQNKVSAVISGYWAIDVVQKWAVQEVRDNLGVATLPIPSFVGGSNLIVWKSSRHPHEATKLAQFLTSKEVQTHLLNDMNLLPARNEAFLYPPFTTNSFYQPVLQALQNGRSFNATYLWGMVEDRLSALISNLWQELFKNPTLDLRQMIDRELDKMAQRLNRTLSAGD